MNTSITVPTRWKMKITAASSQRSSFRASRLAWIASEAMTSGGFRRRLGEVERDNRVDRSPPPEIGFAEAAFDWASGLPLAVVLQRTQLSPGDFVRWVRQVVDLAGQVAQAPGVGELTRTCRQLIGAMRRDIVAFDPDRE